MNSSAVSCAGATSVNRTLSQQGADECTTSEGYRHT